MHSDLYDRYLAILGITQFTLSNPAVLHGEVAISIAAPIRLLVIAEQSHLIQHPLFLSILKAMTIPVSAVQCIQPTQIPLLPNNIHCAIWAIDTTLPDTLAHLPVPQLSTASLTVLQQNSLEKRRLWQSICAYENYFFNDH